MWLLQGRNTLKNASNAFGEKEYNECKERGSSDNLQEEGAS
jgi:hypothetical protein